MPTNLTGEARAKWAEAQAAKNPKVKIRLLREFYSLMPKHKSTERLGMSIKRQIANLEEEIERSRSRKTGSTKLEWLVKKEGFIQIALTGPLELSTYFFNLLTKMNIRSYEALVHPVVGVFEGGSVQFQTVLTPLDLNIGEEKRERFTNMARNADGLLIAIQNDEYLESLISWFEKHNIEILSHRAVVEIVETHTGGLRILGFSERIDYHQITDFLSSYGVRNALVRVSRSATLDDIESALFGRLVKKSIFITSSKDLAQNLKNKIHDIILLDSNFNSDLFGEKILKKLELIRIFTKPLGGDVLSKPLVLKNGSSVVDAAQEIHRDFARFFQYARIWRKNGPQGVRVGRSFRLEDQDIIEIHSS